MDLRTALRTPEATEELLCSAKGCRRAAELAIRWNNPKLHQPDRRKVWLACGEHERTLREFLSMRSFYRDSVTLDQLEPTDG